MFFGLGRVAIEWMIGAFTAHGKDAFFDPAGLPWVAGVESAYPAIRAELDALLAHGQRIPNFQDLSREQASITQGEQWKTYFFFAYGERAETNCRACPATARVLERIPGMKTAMFSILAPGAHLPEHRGPWKGVLRYHLGLLVPEPHTQCGIRVGRETRHWEPGRSLVFDDSHPHEAWNRSGETRVVLFVDFERPLPWPLGFLNRVILGRIRRSPFITDAMEQIRARPVL